MAIEIEIVVVLVTPLYLALGAVYYKVGKIEGLGAANRRRKKEKELIS